MPNVNAEFVLKAHPHSWMLVADNLHSQALALHRRHGESLLVNIDYEVGSTAKWDAVNRSVFLLGGFALENAIKAFLVFENPNWIANGRLARELRSHSLTGLARQSRQIPYAKRGVPVLRVFERGLESWARYPCALNAVETEEEQVLSQRQWTGYLRLMRAYGRQLKKMLSKKWEGPHGTGGRFGFEGDVFEWYPGTGPGPGLSADLRRVKKLPEHTNHDDDHQDGSELIFS